MKKTKTETTKEPEAIKVGDAVTFNGKKYTVVQILTGAKYAAIENETSRIAVEINKLVKS